MSATVIAARPVQTRPPKPRHRARTAGSLAIVAVVVLCFSGIEVKWDRLLDLPQNLWRYALLMFAPPDFSALGRALDATLLSVQMAWFGTVLGIVVSLPLSFLAATGIGPVWLRWPLRILFAVTRAVPEVVIAILILSVTGLTAFTGALAIAIGSIGTLGKWGYEAMEGAERGPIDAARAAGGSTAQVVRWGLWPNAAPEVFAFWLYRFEINVRASAILGLIGAGGIGSMLVDNVQYRQWGSVGMLLIVVVVITVLIDQISGAVRRRIITGRWSSKI
nr:phosphonate ABC transporter, permease protein PhnE [Rhodococcus sp. (in: high G+C Gram-positive bacteria)]